MKKFFWVVDNIIAFCLTTLIFGTVILIAKSRYYHIKVNFNLNIYLITALVLFAIIGIDLLIKHNKKNKTTETKKLKS